MATYEELLESLNEAMAIHAQKAIENLPFNKSELVEIVNDTTADENIYIVWNGSVNYEVYSTTGTKYNIGDKVYVTIPNGDFTQKKYIMGPYVTNSAEGLLYPSPFENYKGTRENIFSGDANLYQIILSSSNDGIGLNENIGFQEDENPSTLEIDQYGNSETWEKEIFKIEDLTQYNKGYRYLALSADIMTDFSHRFSFGDYGIKVDIEYSLKLETILDKVDFTKSYYLDIIGDPYNFITYFNQKTLIPLEKDNPIKTITVYLYTKNNFKILNYEEGQSNFNCINFKNISLEFGDPDSKIEEGVYIYTNDGDTYDSRQASAANKKELHLKWNHYDDVNKIAYEYDEESKANNVEIHWYEEYLYSPGEQVNNDEDIDVISLDAYNEWEANQTDLDKIQNLIETYGLEENKHYTISLDGKYSINYEKTTAAIKNLIKSKKTQEDIDNDVLAGSGWKVLTDKTGQWSITVNPDITKNKTTYLAVIKDGNNIYRSNELIFSNLVQVSDPATVAKLAGLKIKFSDNSNGNYPIYSGNTGEILSKSDIIKERKLEIELNDPISNETYLNGNETIIWKIPKIDNSMIQMDESLYSATKPKIDIDTFLKTYALQEEDISKIKNEEDKYIYIGYKNDIAPNGENGEVYKTQLQQQYKLANFYNKQKTNNTVFAYVIKNGVLYEASKEFVFSQYGTSGSEYTFQVYLGNIVDKDGKFISSSELSLETREGSDKWHKLEIHLFNIAGEEIIDISPSISWYQEPEVKNSIVIQESPFYGIRTRKNKEVDNISYSIADYSYAILQVLVKYGGITFKQLLPLHIRASDFNYTFNGPDKIIYDDKGTNPSQYNLPLSFSPNPNNENIVYRLAGDYSENNLTIKSNKIVPSSIYFSETSKRIKFEAYDTKKELVKYTCPILIIQNKYQIPLVNEWDGSLKIDNEENAILAATMVAGKKDDDNTFTGLLMGQIKKSTSTSSIDTGLFGYKKGTQTFRLGVNGVLTLGASGIGQIEFDGTSGVIEGSGMKINLTNGQESIIFKKKISDNNWETLFEIKSIYNNKIPTGVEMISKGKINIEGKSGSEIDFTDSNNSSNYIRMGLDNNGKPYINSSLFQLGETNRIGGFNIRPEGFYSGNLSILSSGITGTGWGISPSNGFYTTSGYGKTVYVDSDNKELTNITGTLIDYIEDRIKVGNKYKIYETLVLQKSNNEDSSKILPRFNYQITDNLTADGESITIEDLMFDRFGKNIVITASQANGGIQKNLIEFVEWIIERRFGGNDFINPVDAQPKITIAENREYYYNHTPHTFDPRYNNEMESKYPLKAYIFNGGTWGNCTAAVWMLIYHTYGIQLPGSLGNGGNWVDSMTNASIMAGAGLNPWIKTTKPVAGGIISIKRNGYGHVAFIAKIITSEDDYEAMNANEIHYECWEGNYLPPTGSVTGGKAFIIEDCSASRWGDANLYYCKPPEQLIKE